LMAPAVSKGAALPVPVQPPAPPATPPVQGQKATGGPVPAQMIALLQRIRAEVEKNCDYVGNEFADEARRMHRGEIEHRGIYGEATEDQAESLADEGIDVSRVPWVPRADG
jgi:hypothetical protein